MRLMSRHRRVSTWALLWGVSVSSKCKGFALPRSLHSCHEQLAIAQPRARRRPCEILRGGAIDSKRLRQRATKSDDDDPALEDPMVMIVPESRYELRRRRGMSAALAAAYFTVMASKCALPSVLDQLVSPKVGLQFDPSWTSKPQVLLGRLLALSTIAIAAGKLLLGPVIDTLGGILSLQIALSLLAILLGTIAVANSFTVFCVAWIMVDFIFSSCWAASINAIHQVFPDREWAQRIGMLAAAARTGNAAAFAGFAWVLGLAADSDRIRQPWRVVFLASALIQVLPIGLLVGFERIRDPTAAVLPTSTLSGPLDDDSAGSDPPKPPQWRASISALRRIAKTPAFWLHLLSRSTLMVFASFLLFVPLLMKKAYETSSSSAAQVGSIYALGCLLSVSLGSSFYARLSKTARAALVAVLLAMATMSSAAQLGHMVGRWTLSASASAISLFVWGFSFAVPFYIPPSLYALSRGGVESSATIADVFDIGGFGLLAVFNGYVASIQHAKLAAWIPTFQITTTCSAVALICLTLAILLD